MAEGMHAPARSGRWVATARCLQVDQWTVEVIGALQAAGLRPVLLKGPPVARWLYEDDPAARQYVDVDVLVGPTEIDRARLVLSQLGFVNAGAELADDVAHHSQEWNRPGDDAAVDLHRTLHGCEQLSDEAIWAEVIASAQRIEVGGVMADVPGPAVLTLHVVLHLAANDRPGSQTWRDLVRAVERVEGRTWRESAELARRVGVDGEMATKLGMLSPTLVADLGLTSPAPLQLLLSREGSGALALGRLGQLDGLRAKARYCRQKLFPPQAYLSPRIAMANRGPVGLFLARVARAVWCVLRLPTAVAGSLRARSQHRRNT